MKTASPPDWYWLGLRAYGRGETIDNCPCRDGSAELEDWIEGWEFGKLSFIASPDAAEHISAAPAALSRHRVWS
ncbi:hypothetical protein [Methylobacterium sp. 77]|uniref:hypothetical protein n=1 Tax=Methylobacterium sp. 77 TaxID=1101192 RepID=UPI00037D6058|nr:hypothetical protein [Methylobacterium sp. 77]